jgi:hypothetical protein
LITPGGHGVPHYRCGSGECSPMAG